MNSALVNKYKSIENPPGGLVIWILILLELLTFGIALVFMVMLSKEESSIFHSSRLQLNTFIGATNTLVLLTSGYFMAQSFMFYKNAQKEKSLLNINLTILFGFIFLLLKSIEYYLKINNGIHLDTNTFYTFYWLLTGFHFIHVATGIVILFFLRKFSKQEMTDEKIEYFEAGTAFWHMCDLIWLLISPIIYLLF